MIDYANVPGPIGAVVSSKLATLNECATVYSVEDVYLLLEIAGVDAHNRNAQAEHERRKNR